MKMLLALALPLTGLALLQGPPKTPPVKMGLWEVTSTSHISGMQMPNGMTMPDRTVKLHSCFTAESYQKNVLSSDRTRSCSRSNEVWSPDGYEFDIACPQAKGHAKATFGGETWHGTMHMDVDAGGRSMKMDGTYEGKWLSADCGKVSPDSPQIIH